MRTAAIFEFKSDGSVNTLVSPETPTAEAVSLFKQLKAEGHPNRIELWTSTQGRVRRFAGGKHVSKVASLDILRQPAPSDLPKEEGAPAAPVLDAQSEAEDHFSAAE